MRISDQESQAYLHALEHEGNHDRDRDAALRASNVLAYVNMLLHGCRGWHLDVEGGTGGIAEHITLELQRHVAMLIANPYTAARCATTLKQTMRPPPDSPPGTPVVPPECYMARRTPRKNPDGTLRLPRLDSLSLPRGGSDLAHVAIFNESIRRPTTLAHYETRNERRPLGSATLTVSDDRSPAERYEHVSEDACGGCSARVRERMQNTLAYVTQHMSEGGSCLIIRHTSRGTVPEAWEENEEMDAWSDFWIPVRPIWTAHHGAHTFGVQGYVRSGRDMDTGSEYDDVLPTLELCGRERTD